MKRKPLLFHIKTTATETQLALIGLVWHNRQNNRQNIYQEIERKEKDYLLKNERYFFFNGDKERHSVR